MSKNKYNLDELLKRWEREELTLEQAIGQLFLWVSDLAERVQQLERPPKPENQAKASG